MPSQELIDAVNYHLSQGRTREEITDLLVSAGMGEEAVNEIFDNLPKPQSFWQQLPTYPYFKEWDEKTANLPPKIVLSISGLLVGLVLVISLIVYLSMNPSARKGDSRDQERDTVYLQLKIALSRYFENYNRYPSRLSELMPSYIYYVPLDPSTKKPYDYIVSDDGSKYNFCILYETKSPTSGCVDPDVPYIKPGQARANQ